MGDNDAPSNSSVFGTAMNRWLNVNELETLLTPETTALSISSHPPTATPPSGTLILYDRSVTRNYKDDGYEWVKKRNSSKVREDHVKLRVGGRFRVAGCYVHCVNISTLHRRAYHLLDPETGNALAPPSTSGSHSTDRSVSITSANSANTRSQPSLVLVHYLDTERAALYSANLASDGVSLEDPGTGSVNARSKPAGSRRGRRSKSPSSTEGTLDLTSFKSSAPLSFDHYHYHKQNLLQQQPMMAEPRSVQAMQSPQTSFHQQNHVIPHPFHNQDQLHKLQARLHQHASPVVRFQNQEKLTHQPSQSTSFDDDTLDILWGMVVEENGGGAGAMMDNTNLGLMLENTGSIGAILENSGALDLLEGCVAEEDDIRTKEGMAAVAASAVSAFERDLRATNLSLGSDTGNTVGELGASLAATVEAKVEQQPTPQDQQHSPAEHQRHSGSLVCSSHSPCQSGLPPHGGGNVVYPPCPSGQSVQTSSYSNIQRQYGDFYSQRGELQQQQHVFSQNQQFQHLLGKQTHQQREAQNVREQQVSEQAQMQQHIQQPQKHMQQTQWNSPPTAIITPIPGAVDAKIEYRLSEIVKITPNQALINSKRQSKITLSCSEPLPKNPSEDDKIFAWYMLAAFVGSSIAQRKNADLEVRAVDLSPLKRVAPNSYSCTIPPDAKTPGERRIVFVSARLYLGTDPVCDGVAAGVGICLQQAWRNASAKKHNSALSSRPVLSLIGESSSVKNIRILTQLSKDLFYFVGGNEPDKREVYGKSCSSCGTDKIGFIPPD